MRNLDAIINKAIDSMDSAFTSKELFSWILRHHPKKFRVLCHNYIINHRSKTKLMDHLYHLIRKSCKIENINVLQMPTKNNKYIIYGMIKFQENRLTD